MTGKVYKKNNFTISLFLSSVFLGREASWSHRHASRRPAALGAAPLRGSTGSCDSSLEEAETHRHRPPHPPPPLYHRHLSSQERFSPYIQAGPIAVTARTLDPSRHYPEGGGGSDSRLWHREESVGDPGLWQNHANSRTHVSASDDSGSVVDYDQRSVIPPDQSGGIAFRHPAMYHSPWKLEPATRRDNCMRSMNTHVSGSDASLDGGGCDGSVCGESHAGSVFGERHAGSIYGERHAGSVCGERHAGSVCGERHAGKVYGERHASSIYGERHAGSVYGEGHADRVYGERHAGSLYGERHAGSVCGERHAGSVCCGKGGGNYSGRNYNENVCNTSIPRQSDVVYHLPVRNIVKEKERTHASSPPRRGSPSPPKIFPFSLDDCAYTQKGRKVLHAKSSAVPRRNPDQLSAGNGGGGTLPSTVVCETAALVQSGQPAAALVVEGQATQDGSQAEQRDDENDENDIDPTELIF
jgi:hypothetical protein